MFNKICGWVISGSMAVIMAGAAVVTGICVKNALAPNKEEVEGTFEEVKEDK